MPYEPGYTRTGRRFRMPDTPPPQGGSGGYSSARQLYYVVRNLVGGAAATYLWQTYGPHISTWPATIVNNVFRSGVQTITRQAIDQVMPKKKRGSVNTMMSAGKTKMRKIKKKSKKSKAQRNGVVTTFEHNATYSNTGQVAYIGHHTHPIDQVRYEMWVIILKTLINKMNIFPTNRDQTLTVLDFSVGDQFEVEFRSTPTGLISSTTFSVAAGTTFNNIVSWAGDVTRSWFTGESGQTTLEKIRFLPSSLTSPAACEVNLSNALITINSKSAMKMQNRTINSTGNDQADDVDNVPLYGKGYLCRGNQGRLFTAAGLNETIIASPSSGAISTTSGTGDGLPEEPPQPGFFRNVRAHGKFHLDPAQVKTSVVSGRFKGFVNTLLNQINGITTGLKRVSLGTSKFYAIEKMINSTPAQPIVISYEINTTFYSTMKVKSFQPMKPSLFSV